jgi:hypothetical protein
MFRDFYAEMVVVRGKMQECNAVKAGEKERGKGRYNERNQEESKEGMSCLYFFKHLAIKKYDEWSYGSKHC